MGFLQNVRTVFLGNMNELLNKTIDMNSIPVLKQHVRNLEDAISNAEHQSAVARAQCTTLSRDKKNAEDQLAADERRASAYLASNDEASARQVATRIHDEKQNVANLVMQIATADEQAHQLDTAVEQLRGRHHDILNRVRGLEMTARSTKVYEQGNASIKASAAALNTGVDSHVDDVAHRIEERADVAKEEFTRSVAEMSVPEDPLKKEAVDNILAELRAKVPAAVA